MGKRDISKHAHDRIKERGLSFGFVRDVVSGRVRSVRLSTKRPNCIILTALGNKNIAWSIIYDTKRNKVITVRWAHEKEKRCYEKKYKTHKR